MNLLTNGDPQIQQRGTTFSNLGGGFTADRWYYSEASPSNQITLGIGGAAPGACGTIKVQRPQGSSGTSQKALFQSLPTAESLKAPGSAVFTVWAKAGANFSAANLSMLILGSTGQDQLSSSMGNWAGQSTLGSFQAGVSNAMLPYSLAVSVPSNVKQLGAYLCWNPHGTAGADDSITFGGFDFRSGMVAPLAMEPEDYMTSFVKCAGFYEELGRIDGGEPVCLENLIITPQQSDGHTWGQGTLHMLPKRFYKRTVLEMSANLATDIHFTPLTQGSIYPCGKGPMQPLHRSPTRMMIQFGWNGGLPAGYLPGMAAHFAIDGTPPAVTPHFAVSCDL